jgi:hypothetical protein
MKCLDSGEFPDDRRRLAITIDKYLEECEPAVTAAELGKILLDVRSTAIRESKALSPAQKVFLVLFREGRLLQRAADPSSLVGTRRYLITKEMIDLYPELGKVPNARRIDLALKA